MCGCVGISSLSPWWWEDGVWSFVVSRSYWLDTEVVLTRWYSYLTRYLHIMYVTMGAITNGLNSFFDSK